MEIAGNFILYIYHLRQLILFKKNKVGTICKHNNKKNKIP